MYDDDIISAEEHRVRAAQWEADQLRAREARLRQEREWASSHPVEWRGWQRLQPLLDTLWDIMSDVPFDFDEFLKEVGRAPSRTHAVERCDERLPYRRGNLVWAARTPEPAPTPSPYLNTREAAAYLGMTYGTFRNIAKQVKRCPGNRKYTTAALDEFAQRRRK